MQTATLLAVLLLIVLNLRELYQERRILRREGRLKMDVDTILQKVTDQKGVIDSTKTLLETLSAEIKAAGTDPAKLQAISDALDSNTTELSDAVAANPA